MRKLVITATLAAALAVTSAPAAAAPVQGLDLTFQGRTPAAGEAAAEISTFDPATKRAFVTNAAANSLDVFDLSDPASPVPLPSVRARCVRRPSQQRRLHPQMRRPGRGGDGGA